MQIEIQNLLCYTHSDKQRSNGPLPIMGSDPLGCFDRKFRKQVSRSTRLIRDYHNGELLHEEGGDESQTSYHLGAGIDALQRGQDLSYYQRDEQLSTAFITGRGGEIQNGYLYDAFGVESEANEQFQNCIRYTGQQYDDLTGQYYLRARYYNPVLERFMLEDVYQGDGLNLYAYCGNNPVVYNDPSRYKKR